MAVSCDRIVYDKKFSRMTNTRADIHYNEGTFVGTD